MPSEKRKASEAGKAEYSRNMITPRGLFGGVMTIDELNFQSQNLEKEKQLLICRCDLEGMIAENKMREIQGYSPAYGEDSFADLQQRIIDLTKL